METLIILALLLFAAPLAVVATPPLRRRLISAPLKRLLQRLLPDLSSTEQEALEAGSVSWDAELFSGHPDWRKLHAIPPPQLSEAEQAFLDGPVETLCNRLDDWQITAHDHDLPPAIWEQLKRERFFGMVIPERYGGLGFSAEAHSQVVVKIASRSITTAVTVMVPNSLGPGELLLRYGTQAQRDHYLPRLASGEEIPCFALTSPKAGSDAASLEDSGVVCRGRFEGHIVTGIRLNWDKRYITLAPVATLLGLAFRLYDPQRLLGGPRDYGISCALIPTSTPGVECGERHLPLDQAFMNGPTRGHDVFIPIDWIIGGAERAGQGWRMLMESLAAGRAISLPALATGGGKLVARAVGSYARVRQQFHTPIGRFEGVEEPLARIAGHSYTMEAARQLSCALIDRGEQPVVVSAMLKYHLTEQMRRVVNDGIDILGGRGIMLGPRNFLARIYQAIPISITVEGANILTRNLIIFGQGALRCHPWLLEEMTTARADDDEALRRFDRALLGHTRHLLGNLLRAPLLAWSGGRLARRLPAGPLHPHYRQLARLSAALAITAELALLTLGGALKRRERLSARLGDILSQLFIASATLYRFHPSAGDIEERWLLDWGIIDALHRAGEALSGALRELPYGWLLRPMLLPFGNPWPPPNDRLDHRVAGLLLAPGSVRDRLTHGIHLPHHGDYPLTLLEEALLRTIETEPLERRLDEARRNGQLQDGDEQRRLASALEQGVINPTEAELLQHAWRARDRAIAVDAHPHSVKEAHHGHETAA